MNPAVAEMGSSFFRVMTIITALFMLPWMVSIWLSSNRGDRIVLLVFAAMILTPVGMVVFRSLK